MIGCRGVIRGVLAAVGILVLSPLGGMVAPLGAALALLGGAF